LGKLIGRVINQVHSGSMTPILSGFVDFADGIDHQSLDELERLINERRGKKEETTAHQITPDQATIIDVDVPGDQA